MPGLDLSLYLIADCSVAETRLLVEAVAEALAGGVTAVQLRAKNLPDREVFQLGLALNEHTDRWGVPFLVNDRADLALALDASGVHLGQGDLPPEIARKIIGPLRYIGVSVETEEEARLAIARGADYLGTGPVFATKTKIDAGEPYGPELVSRIKGAVTVPVVAIGGITMTNASGVLEAGADGLAVCSAILRSPCPREAAARLRWLTDVQKKKTAKADG